MSDSLLIHLHEKISREQRILSLRQKPLVVWLTGLSGSGKSTLASALERNLVAKGFKAYHLDGDIVRTGLNKDLGFSADDRKENIRRIGELCKLMNDAGLIVITSFISPFRVDRDQVRALLAPSDFAEVYVDSALETCEARDVKGLYQKARKGIIRDFTGISSPYEKPLNPELTLHTDREAESESISRLLDYVIPRVQSA